MNILIVDDDFVSRTKMRTIIQSLGTCIDEEIAQNALENFEKALDEGRPFDLVTLDIHMPVMDGTEMLYRIREAEKKRNIPKASRAKVIMVTSQSDKDSLITCLQAGCDGFVVKPFTRETLFKKFETVGLKTDDSNNVSEDIKSKPQPGKRKNLIEEVSKALKGDTVNLPSLPDINTRLKEMVQKQINTAEITDLLKKDMLIASSLISLSNSPLFRGVGKNKTLEEAIGRLGIDQTFKHVEMLCQRALYSDVSKKYSAYVENLWKHAQACAYAAQFVADHLRVTLLEDPFTLGLVHDIGRLILLQIIGKLEEVGPTGDDVDENVLYTTLDSHHGEFGAALLSKWGFSETFANVAKFHDCPDKAERMSPELALISFVNVLVNNPKKTTEELTVHPLVVTFCGTFGINTGSLADIRGIVEKVLKEKVF
ncbi:MAG: HDOD domain-containing protein [Desulfobacteraceae bacterium]|jgi:HD-like signal output (HDOD) protein/FixJ family two-component response regulator